MISKISKGRGFSGLLAYVSGKKGAEYLCGNVSENPGQAAREMGILRQYSQCKTPVWHCSLSLSPQDRHLANEEFAELARKFLQKMGLEHNQYTVYRHTDKEHAHVHIVANRIDLSPEHKVWNAWQDVTRARQAKAELELEYQLVSTPYSPKFAQPEISRGQAEGARRMGKIPDRQFIAEAISIAAEKGDVRSFVKNLDRQGIKAIPNLSTTGRMNGFSFLFGKRHYKGSQLRCAWKELSARLGYIPEKDNDFLYSLLPTEKQPSRAAEPKEPPRRQHCIYSMPEWEKMGGAKGSDYKRAYRMISEEFSLKDVAQELRLQNSKLSDRQIEKILYNSGKFWVENNKNKLDWAYNKRRRSIRFSNDPAIMILEVLMLLIGAAVKSSLRNLEKHQTARRIENLSTELQKMANYAEERAERAQRREREREREGNPLLRHARELSLERPR